ncbi:hypothetical protein C1O25_15935 [Vibrio diazotrophicus]|uniref:DUF3265 domain-containing protein n=1 Tax=Vibrio diazotrophicus TaxID=685 RepID=A0ABX4W810_VIBDI|nr:hypothetical protein C1O25_15935 [Vibrio diazotrophicus]
MECPPYTFSTLITNCSRGILNAWHFHCALILVFKAVCSSSSIVLLPLNGLHGLPLLSAIALSDNSGSDSSSTFGI